MSNLTKVNLPSYKELLEQSRARNKDKEDLCRLKLKAIAGFLGKSELYSHINTIRDKIRPYDGYVTVKERNFFLGCYFIIVIENIPYDIAMEIKDYCNDYIL